jgi:simple sugar transport system permease protein
VSLLPFGLTIAGQTFRMAVAYVCAGLGGIWCERSGVVNIALEGILLAGGLSAVVTQVATGNAWAGVGAALACGAAIGAVHALVVVRGRVDAIVSGLSINFVAAGGTRFVLRGLYGSSSNSPSVAGFPALIRGAGGAALLGRAVLDPLWLAAAALVGWTGWTLAQTRFGLRVRACGEDPAAAASAGIDVAAVRIAAVSIGGAITALGGVALAYDQHRFESGMSGGRGFIALAAVILAGWRPARLAMACLVFAGLDALQIVVQSRTGTSLGGLVQMVPYAATLVALGAIARRGGEAAIRGPAALGKAID